jgi:two-component system LytT family response regulator
MRTPPIRTLIVDDEPLARKGLRSLLAPHGDFEIAGESSDGPEAVTHIRSLRPDLVFLDVQMPGLDGFGVVRAVGVEAMPAIIFVTAFDQHALDAFKVHAVDYLLKPIDREQLQFALLRVRSLLAAPSHTQLTALLRSLPRHFEYLERILVKVSGKTLIVPVAEVDYLEADGDYIRVYVQGKYHLIREKMGKIESQLDPGCFVRVHRSTIVRVDRIKELKPLFNGDHVIVLRDGRQLSLSRTYRDHLLASLGGRHLQ